MIRSTLRTLLRRHINEATADNWTDDDLNEMLNEGLRYMARRVRRLRPDAFTYIDTIDVVNGQNLYPLPVGFSGEQEVAVKDTAASGGYRALDKEPYHIARDLTSGDQVYFMLGRYLGVAPTPGASVAAGIRLTWSPVLSMATDSDVPDLHLDLHMGIVYAAKIYILGETKDETKSAREELEILIGDVLVNEQLAGPNEILSIDAESLGKGY